MEKIDFEKGLQKRVNDFDDFGPFLSFVKKVEKSFFTPLKAFLACFELRWRYNFGKNSL